MLLAELLRKLTVPYKIRAAKSVSAMSIDIDSVTIDSRQMGKKSIFIALPGVRSNGEDYIPVAIKQGAVAIIASEGACKQFFSHYPHVCFIYTHDIYCALKNCIQLFYKHMPRVIVGVTGTNGKTSVVNFLRQLWELVGKEAASLGTLGIISKPFTQPGQLTTPDPISLAQTLSTLAHKNVHHVALEMSSHGLVQHRLDAIKAKAVGFTSFSQDHLDFHRSMQKYLEAKLTIFNLLDSQGTAVLNADMPIFNKVREAVQGKNILSYGKSGKDIKINYVEAELEGQIASCDIEGVPYKIKIPLLGRFQLMNIFCALGLARATVPDVPMNQLVEALSALKSIKGRLEWAGTTRTKAGVYVDYAHTPDALEQALQALRPHTGNRLYIVFGCGGNRDKKKRGLMGEIVHRYADTIIVTDDNPRFEDPESIRKEIIRKCPRAIEVPNRAQAIQFALDQLGPGDILLIAGKGHEEGQIIGEEILPHNDKKSVQTYLDSE